MNDNLLIQQDLKHVWHPCSKMKDFERFPPIIIQKAKGSLLYTKDGPIIDAISSWWCKSLGHGHPAVLAAIQTQLAQFEHVIGANTTHQSIVELAEQLCELSGKQHVFFASDGSSAVEIALKLAIHSSALKGQSERNQIIALKQGYHGETLATLSISDLGLYKQPYTQFQLPCHFINHIPYVLNQEDPLWHNAQKEWNIVEQELNAIKDSACAVIVEPIVQGAAGMKCYSADFLKRLAQWAKSNDIYFIADEIMTGLGRTGQWLACDHAKVQADIICLSKGLTSGSIPFSCVLVDDAIYQLFYHEHEPTKSFLHSHTYSGNALAVSAALATIQVMRDININQKAATLGQWMVEAFSEIASLTGVLTQVRSIGAWVAGDLKPQAQQPRAAFLLAQEALKRGALIRPIGNTLYWLPPMTTDKSTIEQLAEITLESIKAVYACGG